MSEYLDFMLADLVPAARAVLLPAFAALGQGGELNVATKTDGSPASDADRVGEERLRALIRARYPAHGIVGEEFGRDVPAGAAHVWVLDPLDGTKEFLAREAGWGTLIGLLQDGRPVAGVIDEPLKGVAHGLIVPSPVKSAELAGFSIACTGPQTMFAGTPYEAGVRRLFAAVREIRPRLNCLGFAYVARSDIELAIENGLKLHDIVALLPVLWSAGMACFTLERMDYRDHVFDITMLSQNYSLITGQPDAVRQAFAIMEAA